MDAFRNLLKGWGGKVLLVIFILPFAFFGIEGLFQAGGGSDAEITVNGQEISKTEIDRAAEMQRQNLLRQLGGQIDASAISLESVRPSASEMLVNKYVLEQAIESQGMNVSVETAKAYIRDMPQFKDADGKFSQERVEQLLAHSGYTANGLLLEVENDLLTKQLQAAISATALVGADEAKALLTLSKQKRDFSVMTLNASDYLDKVEVTEADLKAHYDANTERFQNPQKVKAEYLHVTRDNFTVPDSDIDEDTLKQAFDKEQSKLKSKERRRAQHILVDTALHDDEKALEKIKQAQTELQGGADFTDVAQKYSDDSSTAKLGGDLGFNGRGVFDEAFEEALFSLNKDQVSDIVKSEFGYHLIRLTAIESSDGLDFETEKPRLLAQVKAELAQEKLELITDELSEKAFEHNDTLVDAAELVGSKPQQSEWISQAGGDGVLSQRKVLTKLFDPEFIEARENSDLIELESGDLVLVRVTDYQPASIRAMQDVLPQVKESVTAEKAKVHVADLANKWIAELKDGAAPDTIATASGKAWEAKKGVDRNSSDLQHQAIGKGFAMPAPADNKPTYDKLALDTGDQLLISVTGVTDVDASTVDTDLSNFMVALRSGVGKADFNSYVESLKNDADIERAGDE